MENSKCRKTTDEKCECSHHIKGVVCDVKSCVHHDGSNYCSAEKIAIGPSYATSCTDTACATFKPKN